MQNEHVGELNVDRNVYHIQEKGKKAWKEKRICTITRKEQQFCDECMEYLHTFRLGRYLHLICTILVLKSFIKDHIFFVI